ncbi:MULTISPECIES: TetR/AcrR family transcriptional regulator [unclassified Aureispira]|uniref:TetR/AcrR family transcriptional regulator n=1 Tax=unclassified Aureispira TaxID=2649989 RepID=UPI0006988DBD|nr:MULTISPECIES: TetR/AcrR family transcriptional regulator [unclassified Aureispira]WMX12235.1 TetR/AcrR family transcriptional regulator [Aureispira sp. CCB-E]
MIAIQIQLNANLYLRDPQETKLGKRIIEHSIILIDKLGFEKFTFKKLATQIESTEASIYRYFKNKHKLLIYLVSWYWEWMKYQIDFNTMNIEDVDKRLKIALSVLVESSRKNPAISYVDENLLHNIVVAESSKAYHTKLVDKENKEGYFTNYKVLCESISKIILEKSPSYPYPKALASTLIEMANNNIYFAQHLPALTDIKIPDNGELEEVQRLLEHFAFASIAAAV